MFEFFFIPLTLLCYLYCINCFNVDTKFPIIFKPTFSEKSESYFGLAVDMQKIDNQIKFLIGAPKANSTLYPVKQSGTVFKCGITNLSLITTSCTEIDMNFREINPLNEKFIKIKPTNNMFLGGTIVSKPNSNEVAVCGHLWANELNIKSSRQINPTGSCFMIDMQRTYAQPIGIFPLTDSSLQYKYSTYYYSHAMSGFSATFSENTNRLLLGAPGFYQWRGTMLEIEDISSGATNSFAKEKFLIQQSYKFQTESYFGYSLVSGHFLAGTPTSIACGAPRDLNYRGRVYIYNMVNGLRNEETTVMFSSIDGTKIGEYFGASLLAMNINNDAYTDLIVGAPFYSSPGQISGDKGRVYVYLSNGNGFNEPQILVGSDSVDSRFGTSLANLGDINFDGYNDLAIGAPYEQEGGAVYIYNGYKSGIISEYSQRISAKQHLSGINLKGFGISISGNKDVDNNYYPDLLIGSYLSNKAILLRTQPIANIKAEVKLDSDHINVDDKKCDNTEQSSNRKLVPCVRISYCFRYDGQHVPLMQNINISLQLDSRRAENARCFVTIQNQRITTINKILTLSANSNVKCFEQYTVYLREKSNIDDIFTPIEFSLSYNLIPIQSGNTFCPQCSIVKTNEPIIKKLYFETGCSSDDKCVSNLRISAKMLSNNILMDTNHIIEGFHKNLTLIIDIHNSGEPSYLTKLLVSSKPILNILKQDSLCVLPKINLQKDNKLNFIECDAGNPLESGNQKQINIPFDLTHLDTGINKIEFNILLKTASDTTVDSKTALNITLDLKRRASLEIFGNSLKSEEIYESRQKRKSDLVPFSAHLQVIKQNSSTVENVMIEVLFPSLFQGRPLVFRPHIEIIRGVSVNCNRTLSQLPVLPNEISSGLPISSIQSSRLINNKNSTEKQKRAINRIKKEGNENKNTLILKCNSKIECFKLECFAGPFKPDKQSAQFILHSGINITSIESIYGKDYDNINLILESSAQILDEQISDSKIQKISTNIKFKRVDLFVEPIPKWIIFVSAGIGFLILVLIVLILIKLGFFRRKQKEELQSMTKEDLKKDSGSLLEMDEKCIQNDLNDCDSSDDLDNELKH